jgi:hypothetical protein
MFLIVAALSVLSLPADDPRATVRVDSVRKDVVVSAGPFNVMAMPPGMKHDAMEAMPDHSTPVLRFEWPVNGWLRGFRVEVVDGQGNLVDRRIIHHLIGVNFDRRQLLYPAVERLFGIGRETEDLSVPRTIGVPMSPGMHLGMYMAWQNETGKDLHDITIRVHLEYSPANLNPRPVDALPLYMDVNLTVGGSNEFDVPIGKSEKSWEFTMPAGGRLLGFSGHLHDYGAGLRLEDVGSGKVIATVKATRAPDGKLLKLSRSLPGVGGDGIELKGGRKYRVVGMYDNPTGEPIAKAMAHITGIFAPDKMAKWPVIDLADQTLQDDLASLDETGKSEHSHQH